MNIASSPASTATILKHANKAMPTMETFTICHQHRKAHKAFCVFAETKNITPRFNWGGGKQQHYNFQDLRSEMNEKCSAFESISRYFCTFHSNCYQNKSLLRLSILMLLMNLIILLRSSPSTISMVPFYSYARRLWESFTFNVYFCWKKSRAKKYFFAVDLCSLERYDFYFHRGALPKGEKADSDWGGVVLLFSGSLWYLR